MLPLSRSHRTLLVLLLDLGVVPKIALLVIVVLVEMAPGPVGTDEALLLLLLVQSLCGQEIMKMTASPSLLLLILILILILLNGLLATVEAQELLVKLLDERRPLLVCPCFLVAATLIRAVCVCFSIEGVLRTVVLCHVMSCTSRPGSML